MTSSPPELAQLILAEASNEIEYSRALVVGMAKNLTRNMKLRAAVVENQNMHPVDFVNYVALKGSPMQKQGLAQELGIRHCLGMTAAVNEVAGDVEKYTDFITFLEVGIKDCADHFGCQVSGSITVMADAVFEQYRHLSALDFILFWHRVKAGQYLGQYQHLSSKGVNMYFIQDWMNQYLDERESEVAAIKTQFEINEIGQKPITDPQRPQDAIAIVDDLAKLFNLPEEIQCRIQTRKLREREAVGIKTEWERRHFADWKPALGMLCAWAFPDNRKAAGQRIREIVDQNLETVTDLDWVDVKGIQHRFRIQETPELFTEKVIRMLSFKLKRIQPHDLLHQALKQHFSERDITDAATAWLELFPAEEPDPKVADLSLDRFIEIAVTKTIAAISTDWQRYRDDMLQAWAETEGQIYPLSKTEHALMSATMWLQAVGIKSPIWDVLDNVFQNQGQ